MKRLIFKQWRTDFSKSYNYLSFQWYKRLHSTCKRPKNVNTVNFPHKLYLVLLVWSPRTSLRIQWMKLQEGRVRNTPVWDEQPAAVHSEQPTVCTQTLLMVCTAEQLCPPGSCRLVKLLCHDCFFRVTTVFLDVRLSIYQLAGNISPVNTFSWARRNAFMNCL